MKKIFAVLLCVLLVLPIFSGCTPSHSLQVGFGRVDISPAESVPLRGYGGNTSDRMSTEVADPIYATCLAFTDETDKTVLVFYLDFHGCVGDTMLYARSKISKATGIPMGQIMITSTHMHSSPDILNTEISSIERYIDSLQKWLLEAAQAALADRKPAEMYTATAYPQGLNYVRHYVMSDGSIAGDNFGETAGKTYTGHVTEADNQLQMIKFVREGAKDVILVNWQGHPHVAGWANGAPTTIVTADMVGAMRDEMEEKLDCQFAYFAGGSGNINNNSRIQQEQITKTHIEHGKAIADYAIKAASEFKKAEIGTVQILGKNYAGTRVDGHGTLDIPIFAMSLGDVSFVFAPYEMFDTNGVEIKEGSPFSMTFVATSSNFALSYIPSARGYEYGAEYEVNSSKFVKGTAELLVTEYLTLLNQLHKTRK